MVYYGEYKDNDAVKSYCQTCRDFTHHPNDMCISCVWQQRDNNKQKEK